MFERGISGKRTTYSEQDEENVPAPYQPPRRTVASRPVPEQQEQKAQTPAIILPEKPLTSGQKMSQSMGDIGRSLWYGKQTGPEQLWQSPDARYSYGPSTKQIMAEITTNIGIGLAGGGVVRIASPAARLATGRARTVYRISKGVMGGSAVVGTGAFGYQTHKQIASGDTRSASIGLLSFISGSTAFGLGAGAFDSRSNEMLAKIKQASDINMKTGTPGSVQAGMKGIIQGRDVLNTKETIIRNNIKVGETFQHIEDVVYKPSGKPELFLDTKFQQEGGKIISFGGAEVQPRVIPGIKKPMRIDVVTGIEYRTGEVKGNIRYTRSFIYNKYEPEFKPYSDYAPSKMKFTKPASDILNKITKPSESKSYKGNIQSRGLITEFQKPTLQYERYLKQFEMEPPVFRAYPPKSSFIIPIPVGFQIHRTDTSSDIMKMYGGMSESGFAHSKDILRTPRNLDRFLNRSLNRSARLSVPSIISRQHKGTKQNQDVIPRQNSIQNPMVNTSFKSSEESLSRYMKTFYPPGFFRRKRLYGPGGNAFSDSAASPFYKFREFRIPELKF